MKLIKIIFIFLFAFSLKTEADVVLPRVLGHQMVLQQQKPIVIWGKANVGEQVSVSFANESAQTTTDKNGKWKVVLNPLKASFENRDMTIKGLNTIVLKDILVGEVWLCSGQSNMEYTMRKNSKVDAEQAKGLNPSPINELDFANYPNIRLFLVNRKELVKPSLEHEGWDIAEGTALRNFSAVGYFFAKNIHKDLNVPVGIIASSVPGSRIEPWINEEDFTKSAYFKDKNIEGDPAKFYHPMIEPLIPFAIKGFLWYQGESNHFERESYTTATQALITTWRDRFKQGELPFYYVQIAPFYHDKEDPKLAFDAFFREAQEKVAELNNTEMVSTMDVGEAKDLHPKNKRPIGLRLAAVALNRTYNQLQVPYQGPMYNYVVFDKSKAIVHFNPETLSGGLVTNDGQAAKFFYLAGSDQVFYPADAEIQNGSVVVTSKSVKKPIAVRYAFFNYPVTNLQNKAGFPVMPFRTDNWQEQK